MSPVTQTARIQIRRGLYVNLPVLASGELGWATDTQQLFIGTGTNNILIAGSIGNISLGGNGLPVVSSTITGNAASALATGITGPAANVGGLITYTLLITPALGERAYFHMQLIVQTLLCGMMNTKVLI